MPEIFRSLQVRDYRIYVSGHGVSQMGTWMQRLAVIWAVFEITDSGVAVGVASACLFGPALVLSPVAGLMADRHDGRSLLLLTKVGLTATAIGLSAVAFARPSTPVPYFVLGVLFGIVETFDIPVRMTFVGELVERADLPNAVGLNTATMNASRVIGPALGGVLISTSGVEWCFAVNIVLAVTVLVSMFAIHPRPPVDRTLRSQGGALEGFRIAWDHEELRYTLLSFAVFSVFVLAFPVTLPLLAERSLAGGPGVFTLLFTSLSLGSIPGALLVARSSEPDIVFLGWAAMFTSLTMGALALAPNVAVAVVLCSVAGTATMAFMTASITVVQLQAPLERRGRVLSLVSMIGVGSRAIGGLVMGTVVDLVNARTAIGLGAGISLGVGVGALLGVLAQPRGTADSRLHERRAGHALSANQSDRLS